MPERLRDRNPESTTEFEDPERLGEVERLVGCDCDIRTLERATRSGEVTAVGVDTGG